MSTPTTRGTIRESGILAVEGHQCRRKDEATEAVAADRGVNYGMVAYPRQPAGIAGRIARVPVHERLSLYRANDIAPEAARRRDT